MIMKNQVLSVEQMQHLINLGVDVSSASMAWGKPDGEKEYHLLLPNLQETFEYGLVIKYIPAFTLQDMLALMPKQIDDYTLNWYISEMIFRYDKIDLFGKFEVLEDLSFYFNENATILNVAYGMLCKLAECGYLNNKH